MQPEGKPLPRAIVCCVCSGPLFRSLLTSWPFCARAGKDGRIQNDRHRPVTREVRSGFNRGLGAGGGGGGGSLSGLRRVRGYRGCVCV